MLSFQDTTKLLRKYNIPVLGVVVKNANQCVAASKRVGYPVALKILSPDVVHKSESGGVKVGLQNQKEVEMGYLEIVKSVKSKFPEANIDGVLVQTMMRGVEILIGMKKDAQFGPVIVFGLGGIFVEVLKDVSMRIAPITRKDAVEMIGEIKGRKLLEGYRGGPKVNKAALVKLLLAVSKLSMKENVQEIDFNPVIIDEKKAVVVDARVLR